MPFTNPIVAGTKLIREAIQSPDYVAGSSGWTINKDGTAEFNDVTVRGDIYVSDVNGSYIRIFNSNGPVILFNPQDRTGINWSAGSIFSYGGPLPEGYTYLNLQSPSGNGGDPASLTLESFTDGQPAAMTSYQDTNVLGNLQVQGNTDASGYATHKTYGGKVFLPVARSIPTATYTPVNYNGIVAEYDNGGWWDGSSKIIPILPFPAWIDVTFTTLWAGSASLTARRTVAAVNGNLIPPATIDPIAPNGVQFTQTCTTTVLVDGVNDYIEHMAYQQTGANLNVNGDGGATTFCTTMHWRFNSYA